MIVYNIHLLIEREFSCQTWKSPYVVENEEDDYCDDIHERRMPACSDTNTGTLTLLTPVGIDYATMLRIINDAFKMANEVFRVSKRENHILNYQLEVVNISQSFFSLLEALDKFGLSILKEVIEKILDK